MLRNSPRRAAKGRGEGNVGRSVSQIAIGPPRSGRVGPRESRRVADHSPLSDGSVPSSWRTRGRAHPALACLTVRAEGGRIHFAAPRHLPFRRGKDGAAPSFIPEQRGDGARHGGSRNATHRSGQAHLAAADLRAHRGRRVHHLATERIARQARRLHPATLGGGGTRRGSSGYGGCHDRLGVQVRRGGATKPGQGRQPIQVGRQGSGAPLQLQRLGRMAADHRRQPRYAAQRGQRLLPEVRLQAGDGPHGRSGGGPRRLCLR